MVRWIFAVALLLAASGAQAQQRETRIALIIANEAYVSANLGRLPGTTRDAALMRTALERAGFQVTARSNLTRAQMRSELSAFANRLAQLGERGVGFLYYAGHGAADGPRGQNYLVPVDAHINGVPDLPATSLPLNEELDGIALAGARATIVVIDACRNTPVALRRGARGLAAVDARADTLIAFATDAGETASDDGVYARVLAEELQRPGADAVVVFARVQTRVAQATNRAQRPTSINGLLGSPIVFVGADAVGLQPRPLDQALRAREPDVARNVVPTSIRGLGIEVIETSAGLTITKVEGRSDLAQQGVRAGAMIVRAGGRAVSSVDELQTEVSVAENRVSWPGVFATVSGIDTNSSIALELRLDGGVLRTLNAEIMWLDW